MSSEVGAIQLAFIEEYSGIFNWAMEGLQRLMKQKWFTLPESSKTALEDYLLGEDPVAQFLQEHTERLDAGVPTQQATLAATVYQAYQDFCVLNGYRSILNSAQFGKRIKALKVESKQGTGKRNYYYLKLINQAGMAGPSYSKQTPERIDIEELEL